MGGSESLHDIEGQLLSAKQKLSGQTIEADNCKAELRKKEMVRPILSLFCFFLPG